MKNISDLTQFQRFLFACAGRVGQQVNLSSLGNDIGIDYKTIQSWLTVLQASYITFLPPPYYQNFNKRITKSPKLYFFDTGILCYLLGITKADQIQNHALKGQLFENFVINELVKYRYNQGLRSNLFFFRDSAGNEIDVLIDKVVSQTAIEIKAGETLNPDFFRNLRYWKKLTNQDDAKLVFGGTAFHSGISYKDFQVYSWEDLEKTGFA